MRSLILLAPLAAAAFLAAPALADNRASIPGERELACLAEAIYFEARGTGAEGEAAVAHVIVNRSNNPKFPDTVCGVVTQGCQFSYRCDGRSDALTDARSRARAYRAAETVLAGGADPTGGALFFHSARAKPGWFAKRKRTGTIGGNVFYR
ncbi:cell wall hydrolase [Amaricoccus sp.]|uniref:cell wall hydrolase n=1 Tax=Amaricoccus sp. TaxID=1872485 RepID=UPI002631D484|nr:cell wall hydrolase [Amaricoccus sp.]HRO13347.1 cell wall hydrolase [Amaricoccus sp.]